MVIIPPQLELKANSLELPLSAVKKAQASTPLIKATLCTGLVSRKATFCN